MGRHWTFLSNHVHVLICLARDPEARLRDVALSVGITERAVQKIVSDLEAAGVVEQNLANSLLDVKGKIRFCSVCFNFTDKDPCAICADESRSNGVLCIVEGPGDQLALEESGAFKGKYHVLHGVLSPLDGVGPEDLKIGELVGRLGREAIQEVILATNPTSEGEATVSFLHKLLSEKRIKISRIALGIPMGGDLKYMDSLTLRHALKSRTSLSP